MRVDCAGTELRIGDTKMWILKNLNMYPSNIFPGRLSN